VLASSCSFCAQLALHAQVAAAVRILMDSEEHCRVLIVAPKTLLENVWVKELQ